METASSSLASNIRWRLVFPTIFFMFLSSLDRVNVSFASLQMNTDIGLTPTQYGFGASILFVGFLLGQYPSILMLQKIGFRRWLAILGILWGIAATSMAFIDNRYEFYVIRVIIGLAEGGLAPGIVFYLSQFATERERATTFAMPMLAIPLSIILGGPISGWLLDMQAPGGLPGWRWMFLAEGVPTVLLGLAAYFYFPDKPDDAGWISADDKKWLAKNSANRPAESQKNDWSIAFSPIVLSSCLLWFCLLSGAYGIMFWLPQMVHQMTELSALQIGLVNALPWIGAGLGMYFNSAHSDKSGERFWHVGLPAALTAVGIVAAGYAGATAFGLVLLFLTGLALGSAQGGFWALPTALFTPATMAVGVVTINIVGSSGGAVIPYVVGYVREHSSSFMTPLFMIASVMMLGAVMVAFIRARFFTNSKA